MDNPNIEKLNGLNASQLEELVNQAIKKIDGRRLHAKEKEVRKAIDENKVILARRGINKRAFVVRCSGLDGSGKSYLSKIKSLDIKYMNKSHLVYGEYDIVLEFEVYNPQNLTPIFKSIREIDGVNSLKNYVANEKFDF